MACVFVGLCVFVCVCIREAAADRRALGDYGTGRGTITHRRPHRWPQTDSQAGLNADGSLIGICHQEPTKSIYLKGGVGGRPHSHTKQQAHMHTAHISKLQHTLVSFIQLMTHYIPITLAWIIFSFRFPSQTCFQRGRSVFLLSFSILHLGFCKLTTLLVMFLVSENVCYKDFISKCSSEVRLSLQLNAHGTKTRMSLYLTTFVDLICLNNKSENPDNEGIKLL